MTVKMLSSRLFSLLSLGGIRTTYGNKHANLKIPFLGKGVTVLRIFS
jgi:hypothetical protein